MATENFIEYSLLSPVLSVEDFLKKNFNCSSNKLKKYFDKAFLKRSFEKHTTLRLPLNFVNDGKINPSYEGPPINIIYEDDVFLVMDKPQNLFVHPLVYDEKNNCLSFLRKNRWDILNINLLNYDRGLLYRLDFETSGVLVYIKNDREYLNLRHNFKNIAKKKMYYCLVEGECSLNGAFTHYFSSKDIKGKKVIVSADETQGEKGELILSSQSYDPVTKTTLMIVDLKTGLRHQIRAQLAHLGFPLRGDHFYGGSPAGRLYLHAYQYEINFLNKNYMFQAKLKDFKGL